MAKNAGAARSGNAAGAEGAANNAAASEHPLEPHWGDPNRSQVRRDTTRRERIAGLTWLSVGSLFGLFVSVLYLGSRITIGETSIPLPWTIVFAGVFNWIITKTALLWTPNKAIASIPTWVWLAAFIVLLMWPTISASGDTLIPSSISTLGLLAVGLLGGAIPVMYIDPMAGVDSN